MIDDEAGTALLLLPAGVLIMVILASIVVDSTAAFLAQHEAATFSSAIANDSAALAIDHELLQDHGQVSLDPSRLGALQGRAEAQATWQLSAVLDPSTVQVVIQMVDERHLVVEVSGQPQRVIWPSPLSGAGRVRAHAVGWLTDSSGRGGIADPLR